MGKDYTDPEWEKLLNQLTFDEMVTMIGDAFHFRAAVDVLIKHFALNDSETERLGLGVWINEQAAREIYLKVFQAAFEEADANKTI